MKNLKFTILLSLLICFSTKTFTQAENFNPGIIPSTDLFQDCFNCGATDLEYQTGIKYGIGYGVFRALNSRIELTANASFNYWRYDVDYKYYGIHSYSMTESKSYFNLSLGERINLFQFKQSQIYTGVNFNTLLYLNSPNQNIDVSVEPTIGWKRNLGKRQELFAQFGFEQHLTKYLARLDQKPNKFSFQVGVNMNLEQQEKVVEE